MSSTPFGEHLKREREMRGVSLEEVAAATRISTRFLQAIESEQWEQLPGGAFNRGFIRSIARYLGLDEDDLVAEYAVETKGGNGHHAVESSAGMRRNWGPMAAAVLVIALVVAGGLYAYHRYGSVLVSKLHKNTATSLGLANSGTLAQTEPAGNLALKIEASRSANVTVVADGKTVFDGPLRENDVRQFQAASTFQINSSDAGALLLELSGQIMPPIGAAGKPGAVTLSRNNLNPAPGGPSHQR
jgi:transcriptional regulator with XRE-family HTH domain